MSDSSPTTGEAEAKARIRGITVPHDGEFRRCAECQGTIPAPRRKVCSARCARRRKTKLNDYYRRRRRA